MNVVLEPNVIAETKIILSSFLIRGVNTILSVSDILSLKMYRLVNTTLAITQCVIINID